MRLLLSRLVILPLLALAVLLWGCVGPVTPSPDIPATIPAAVEAALPPATPESDATQPTPPTAVPEPTAEPTAELRPTPAPTPRLIPMPTGVPTFAPTATPIPTPTPTPVPPTPTPAPPTPTPTPNLPPGYADLQNAGNLEQTNQAVARAIRNLPWVADGVNPAEQDAAETLIYLAAKSPSLFGNLGGKPWVRSGSFPELDVALHYLERIFSLDPAVAEEIAAMQFLDRLEPSDLVALKSLNRLADDDYEVFRRVMAHRNIRDGIFDQEAEIVALLSGVNRINPDLLATLLGSPRTTLERRTIKLPRAGRVNLTIIRTGPGAARSMDLLEHSVRTIEDFLGVPFPQKYVALLFEDAVSSSADGTNFGTHMAILPRYDVDDGSHEADASGRIIAHEVAHYYWSGAENWLDEGAAEFTAAISEQARVGLPLEPDNYPCSPVSNIKELEQQGYGQGEAGFRCNYSLGERLFLDLHRGLGEYFFLPGLARLYRAVESGNDSQGVKAGIEELRAAFEVNTTSEYAAVNRAILRWYNGTGSYDTENLDTSPVVARLPSVNGWVDRAYVTLSRGGEPVARFSAKEVSDGLWLTLEYSYDLQSSSQELELEVVEYFEDGFPYLRHTFSLVAERRYSGGALWQSVGPGPGQEWAPGRHWVYVYHQGRKVAEVEFEVTR